MAAQVPDWVARKTSRLVAAADLSGEQARWVDRVTRGYAASLPPGRYFALVEARIIEADPEAAEARRRAHALQRFVRTGQTSEHGLKTLVARATSGEVIYLVAVVDRIAQILALQGDTDPAEVRRSKALGILATPARALQLLAWAETEHTDDPVADAELPAEQRNDPDLNAAIAARLARVPVRQLLPPATLYVHLTDAALTTGRGVARLEGVGPITLDQVREFLGHGNLTVTPVVDLNDGAAVDCYEIPARIHQIVKLRHHRVKTHAPGWRHHRIAPAVFLWRTPTGHWFRVDHTGTHHLGTNVSPAEQHLAALIAS